MTITERAVAPWALGYRSAEGEFPEPVELPVRGEIPPGVSGVLYRIGPARHDVHGDRYRHPFDGDSMVHALEFAGGRVRYRARWVETEGKRAEDAAGRRLFGSFGTRPAGGLVDRLRHRSPKNVANINVVPHDGALLALWEGGHPYRLDPVTLDTVGEDDLGVLRAGHTFSAHPKLDAATGELWNFGVEYGPQTRLRLYRLGQVREVVATIPLPRAYMLHDFALSETRAVFVCAPYALPRVPLAFLTGQTSYAGALRWEPSFGTRVLVVDRATGEHTWHVTEPFFVFHVVGAADDGDDTVVDLCAYDDHGIMASLPALMTGGPVPAFAPPLVTRLTVGPRPAQRRRLCELPVEFLRRAGAAGVFGLTVAGDGHLGRPVVLDPVTWSASLVPVGPGVYAGEPVPVRAGSSTLLATLVLDAAAARSEVWLVDAAEPEGGPLARAALPAIVPFGLHGSWVPHPA